MRSCFVLSFLLACSLGACSPGNLRDPGLGGDDDDATAGEGEGEGEGEGGEGEGEGEGEHNPHNGVEVCDQLDNNGDGLVDDVCGCEPQTEQFCYRGHVSTRGRGACHDGVQSCNTDDAEFPHWNDCIGDAMPTDEVCGDGIDNDCDGREDEGCSDVDPCGNGDIPENEICDNGLDEDCDNLVDCDDPDCDCGQPDGGGGEDCAGGAEFGDNACSDGCDNDGNGRTDCADFTCWFSDECRDCGDENTPDLCSDGSDNDCDWMSDCDDPDCQALGEDVCPTECTPGECRWWHVCACCETNDHEADDCPPESCDDPHLKYYSCVNGYWEYAGMVYGCGAGSVPDECDSIVW